MAPEQRTQKTPAAELPSEHCSAGKHSTSLRVMRLTRGTRRSAAGEPGLLPRRPEHQPRQASRTTTTPAQKDSGLWRNAFPRLGACTVSSVRPWSAGPWRLGAVPTARPQERSRKAPKPASHQPFKPRWRQSSERRKPLQPNYSLSIASLAAQCLS